MKMQISSNDVHEPSNCCNGRACFQRYGRNADYAVLGLSRIEYIMPLLLNDFYIRLLYQYDLK